MAVVELAGEFRQRTGKGGANQVRRDGFIPAVLYGGTEEPKSIKIESHVFETLIRTQGGSHSVIDFKLPEHDVIMALIRDVQRHPVSREILHVDFLMIQADKTVEVELPIRLVGTPKGVREGGILEHITRAIDVECLPRDIASHFDVDVSELQIGDSVSVEDITVPNMEVLTEKERTIASVVAPTILAEPTDEEEAEGEEGEEKPEGEEEEKKEEGGEKSE